VRMQLLMRQVCTRLKIPNGWEHEDDEPDS
jgi:hypothetical protein